jgi:DNA-binding MarR family transcriptional regulator
VSAQVAQGGRDVESLGVPMWVVETTYALRRRGRPYQAGPTDLATELGVTQAAMTARIRHLVQPGLVVRAADPDDGRRVDVLLTGEGHRLTEQIFRLQAGVEESRLAPLTAGERTELDRLLRKLLAAATSQADRL